MHKRLIFIPIFIITTSINLTSERRAVFGVRIAYQSTGEMISLVSFITDGKYLYNKKILSRREFSFFASGEWPSIYNQKRVNLFDKNNVLGGIYKDSISLKKMDYCFSIDSLWKIRYRLYPFQGKSEYGWSQESYAPSTRQKKYIFDRYNVDQIDGKFFMDTSFWKLLRDVRDPQWISTYKAI